MPPRQEDSRSHRQIWLVLHARAFSFHPQFFSPVPSGCWGCSQGTRQRIAMKMMGEMVPSASASLPATALFGSESSRGSAQSYGRCFGTGMEQPCRYFMQQGTGAANVANMRVSWAGGEILQPKGCAGSGPSSGGGNATCATGPGRAMAATSRNRGGATPLRLSTARHCFMQKKKKKNQSLGLFHSKLLPAPAVRQGSFQLVFPMASFPKCPLCLFFADGFIAFFANFFCWFVALAFPWSKGRLG